MYIDQLFDICPQFGWQGGPAFSTRIQTTATGVERRNALQAQCRHQYSLPMQLIGDDYLLRLKQMFLAARGMCNSFRIKDYSDYVASNEVFFEGDGATKVFQLSKLSIWGAASYTRIVNKPANPIAVRVNGAVVTPAIDYTTGKVTFAAAPTVGAIGTWSGEFYVQVRFNSDLLSMSINNKSQGDFVQTGSVDLIEVLEE